MTVARKNPRRAFVAFITEDMEVLCINRAKDGKVGLPGGKREEGETIYEAAEREVREEIGVDFCLMNTSHVHKIVYDTSIFFVKMKFTRRASFVIAPKEVKSVEWINVSYLVNFCVDEADKVHKPLLLATVFMNPNLLQLLS